MGREFALNKPSSSNKGTIVSDVFNQLASLKPDLVQCRVLIIHSTVAGGGLHNGVQIPFL
jgi:hypothetical protein